MRPLPLSLVLAIAVLTRSAPVAAQARGGNDPQTQGPSAAQVGGQVMATMDGLRANGLGLAKGCDYAQYLNLANTAMTTLGAVKDLRGAWTSLKGAFSGGLPTTDYIGLAVNGASATQTKKSAQAQFQNLLMQIEQTCQSYLQSENVMRQFEVIQAGKLNIGNSLNFVLSGETGLERRRLPAKDASALNAEWTQAFDADLPPSASPQDTMWRTASLAMKQAVTASNDMIGSLEKIETELKVLQEELVLYATWESTTSGTTAPGGHGTPNGNSTPSMGRAGGPAGGAQANGKWTCPDGYPDPNRPTVELRNGKRVCGPASPERSTQVLAHLEVLKTQIQAIQMNADARGLQVDAVKLGIKATQGSKSAYSNLLSAGM